MATMITGWDIGGAHLKVARIDENGRLLYVEQFATPLWRGLDVLDTVLADLRKWPGFSESRHAITMTAELADCFSDRKSGVNAILERFNRVFPGENSRVYAGDAGLVSFDEADGLQERIASANWLATAEYLAGFYGHGLLLDIGSTTTDIIPFHNGRPAPVGMTDHRRLQTGELVYTGVVRTPVMAVVGKVPFRGHWQTIAAESFATMADVYRITGRLQEHHDLTETADGRGKTMEDSVRRLARMVGLDPDPGIPLQAWKELAEYIATRQQKMISEAVNQIIEQNKQDLPAPVLVGAGCGRFLLADLIGQQDTRTADFADHLNADPDLREKAGDNAAAVSLALLVLRRGP